MQHLAFCHLTGFTKRGAKSASCKAGWDRMVA
jgi:hypothetical protein